MFQKVKIIFLGFFLLSAANTWASNESIKLINAQNIVQAFNSQTLTKQTVREKLCPKCKSAGSLQTLVQDAIRLLNKKTVQSCAQKVKEGTVVKVNYMASEICNKKKKSYLVSQARYEIESWGELTQINLRVRFRAKPYSISDSIAQKMLQDVRKCILPIKKVWKRNGIHLNLTADLQRNHRNTNPHHVVDLVYAAGNSDYKTIHYFDKSLTYDEKVRQNRFCLQLLHETSHLLGLVDEYQNSYCSDRPVVADNGIPMSVLGDEYYGWENIEFFPRHIKRVVTPLCSSKRCFGPLCK